MATISTGAPFLDTFLNGGYEQAVLTTIYGPSGSGKTNLCLLSAMKMAQAGKKVLFMDTEGGIAVERIKQLCADWPQVLPSLLFLNPLTFPEQVQLFKILREMVQDQVGLIIVDSISMLYRLELGRSEEVYEINSALAQQIALLVELARRKSIPVLVTSQVYSDFDNRDLVKIVGGDVLKYGSKCLIELQRRNGVRDLILQKHRSLAEGSKLSFRIIQQGIELAN